MTIELTRRSVVLSALAAGVLIGSPAAANVAGIASDIDNYCTGVEVLEDQLDGNSSSASMEAIKSGVDSAWVRALNGIEEIDVDSLSEADLNKLQSALAIFVEWEKKDDSLLSKWVDVLKAVRAKEGLSGPSTVQSDRARLKSKRDKLKKKIAELMGK